MPKAKYRIRPSKGESGRVRYVIEEKGWIFWREITSHSYGDLALAEEDLLFYVRCKAKDEERSKVYLEYDSKGNIL